MRNAVRQVGRGAADAGEAGDACFGGRPLPTLGQPLSPSVHHRGAFASVPVPSATRRVIESNRKLLLLESSLSHRKQTSEVNPNREFSRRSEVLP
jgi:hypothetical protein